MLRANTQGMSMQSKNRFHLPEASFKELCHATYQIRGRMEAERGSRSRVLLFKH